MKVFADSFLLDITNILVDKCVDGACVKAGDICENLSLDEKEFRGIISAIVRMDLLPEYKNYLGPGRGIGRKDCPPKKSIQSTQPKNLVIPDHFLDELKEVLESLCSNGKVVPCAKIAEEMETAVEKNSKAMVAVAVRRPEFSLYEVKVGRGGGVRLKLTPNTPARVLNHPVRPTEDIAPVVTEKTKEEHRLNLISKVLS